MQRPKNGTLPKLILSLADEITSRPERIELAGWLCHKWGYVQVHQTGSHIILQTEDPQHHRIAIPAHRALRIGTLNAILRDVSRHKSVDRESILRDCG